MKALGERALDLPWLSPCVASLTTLGARRAGSWPQMRCDPGVVLLCARALRAAPPEGADPYPAALVLELALEKLEAGAGGFVDWSQPGPDLVYRAALRQAQLAAALAQKVGVDRDRAWIAAMLAPLGWLAACAVDPAAVPQPAQIPRAGSDLRAAQREAWGLDHTALARRLARRWQLPDWLAVCVGQLGLHVRIAERLGAEPLHFHTVQLAVALYQEHRPGLGLTVGSDLGELLGALNISAADVEELSWQVLGAELAPQTWEPPAAQPLLTELIRLAVDNTHRSEQHLVADLQRDVDRLQEVLERSAAEEKAHLLGLKLSALAELAAGASHEINNPLAVISGQAQYMQKQLHLLDGPADEIDDMAAYLENLRTTLAPSLQKIIGQTQRIHSILTGLMQFARPSPPRPQPVRLSALVREVATSLGELAQEKQVRLVTPEQTMDLLLQADPAQLRMALTGLLRNAIEAAPTDGWAGIRVEQAAHAGVEVIVEDSGPGPAPAQVEHLFDPFYSGRAAGRGRGLGLPTAWRLARQQGGDVRFDGQPDGATRFVLSLPAASVLTHPGLNGKTISAA
jgi:two-component system NtrC family sensor kinase